MSDTLSKIAELDEPAAPQFLFTLGLIKMIRNGNKVKRYHTVDTLVVETVGHHSANVAHLVMTLDPDCSRNLIVAALNHDLTEQFTGDVPATAKWASARLTELLKSLEATYMGPLEVELTEDERCVLKQADMLDLCLKCLEEYQLGNKQITPLIRRGLRFLRENLPTPLTRYIIREIEHELS